jgi:hypothetical protein
LGEIEKGDFIVLGEEYFHITAMNVTSTALRLAFQHLKTNIYSRNGIMIISGVTLLTGVVMWRRYKMKKIIGGVLPPILTRSMSFEAQPCIIKKRTGDCMHDILGCLKLAEQDDLNPSPNAIQHQQASTEFKIEEMGEDETHPLVDFESSAVPKVEFYFEKKIKPFYNLIFTNLNCKSSAECCWCQ